MTANEQISINTIIKDKQQIFEKWLKLIISQNLKKDLLSKDEILNESTDFFSLFVKILENNDYEKNDNIEYKQLLKFLENMSVSRAKLGFTPTETASYIFSLKDIILKHIQNFFITGKVEFNIEIFKILQLLDNLGLYTFEFFTVTREKIISRQQQEIIEVSTPVLHVWDGILALPIIGTLDSIRTQIVMQKLLNAINTSGYSVAILDISGVSVVDTLVAQHLIKTVNAARLMGAECIISGIRPEIAQTMVQLGIDLSFIKTKATLAAALKEAFDILKLKVVKGEK